MQLQLPELLAADSLNVMNFLNEVVLWYPEAISFAPGRPAEQCFDVVSSFDSLALYVAEEARRRELPPDKIYRQLGQYGKTNGIICELICRWLARDEGIQTTPAAVMVTDGAQEGMTILAAGLFERERDVLLVADPTYIGMTGIATILGIELCPVPSGFDSLDLDALLRALVDVRARGKRARALYLVPDFSNPLGTSMTLAARKELLALAAAEDLLIIEDNPYGQFAYDGPPTPTLKSLDRDGVVIYLGTFSKVLYPGLRLGFVIADQTLSTPRASQPETLAQELSKIKSLTTVNTSSLLQGIVGGILLQHDCSLSAQMQPKLSFYRHNRDRMLAALDRHFNGDPLLAGCVSWNQPGGGFFITVTLPFVFDQTLLRQCAEHYGVICSPIAFFALLPGRENQIRLSFSYVTPEQVDQGVARLWRFVHDQIAPGTADSADVLDSRLV